MAMLVMDRTGLVRTSLAVVPLFENWPQGAFDDLCQAAQLWRYGRGENLYQVGEPTRGLFVLVQGTVLNARVYPDGQRMANAILKPGWPIAMPSAWDDGDCAYDGIARTDCLAIVIPRRSLQALLRQTPDLMARVIDMLVAQVRQDTESIVVRSLSSQRCLLAKYLAYLCRPSIYVMREDPTAVDPIATDATQDEVGAMITASRQTVNRLMKGLVRDGVLKRRGALVEIVNFRRLLSVMEEDEPIHPLWRAQILAWHERLANRAGQGMHPGLAAAHRESDLVAG
jgi:CRP-like cAMP-binding protein